MSIFITYTINIAMRILRGIFLLLFLMAILIFFHFLKTSTGTNQQVQFNIDESYYLENTVSKNKIISVPNPNKNAYLRLNNLIVYQRKS